MLQPDPALCCSGISRRAQGDIRSHSGVGLIQRRESSHDSPAKIRKIRKICSFGWWQCHYCESKQKDKFLRLVENIFPVRVSLLWGEDLR